MAEMFHSISEKLAEKLSYDVVFNNLTLDVHKGYWYDPAIGELEQVVVQSIDSPCKL